MPNLTVKQFEEICDDLRSCGYAPFSYSGRSMYGQSCLAVKVDGDTYPQSLVGLFLDIADMKPCVDCQDHNSETHDNLCDLRFDVDNFGRDMVVYWRRITWIDGGDDETTD